jgi:YidC/Oxa1 family membrane protein insertase
MATPKLLFATIKRSHLVLRAISYSSSHQFLAEKPHLTASRFCNQPSSYSKWPFSTTNLPSFYNNFLSCRSYSTTQSSDSNDEFGDDLRGAIDHKSNEEIDFNSPSQIAETLANVGVGTEESIFPVRVVISMLDGCHHLTGLPWWIVIASSTLALRLVLLPVLICQLQKLARISELFPKLPPPLPPPLAGKSYIDHFMFFRKERKSIGCPSYLWFLAYISMQFPCFLLWMTSIRRMSLDHHPGFDTGGILWFQNLTELPHGLLGPILPLLIGGLHFVNVQVSFQKNSIREVKGLFGLLAKYYKIYLNFMTLPLILTAICIPQGSVIYWITNSSITLLQNLTLNHPVIRHKLGLPDAVKNKKLPQGISEPVLLFEPSKVQGKVSVQNLSPQELLAVSTI